MVLDKEEMLELNNRVTPLVNSVLPIFGIDTDYKPELLGTGVLIRLDNRSYLCTAKHLVEDNPDTSFYTYVGKKLDLLGHEFFKVGNYDLIFLEMPNNLMNKLIDFCPLNRSQIAENVLEYKNRYSNVVGFPITKNWIDHQSRNIKSIRYSYASTYKEINNEVVSTDFKKRKNKKTGTDDIISAPDPIGMSGGAMFGIKKMSGNCAPMLVGIMTDWDWRKNKIIGINIEILITYIRNFEKDRKKCI